MNSLNVNPMLMGPQHEHFSRLKDPRAAGNYGQLLELTRNICTGAEIIAQAAKMDRLCRDAGQPTLFSLDHMESMELMASDALKMLADLAMRDIEFMNDHPKAEVKS